MKCRCDTTPYYKTYSCPKGHTWSAMFYPLNAASNIGNSKCLACAVEGMGKRIVEIMESGITAFCGEGE